MGVARQGVWMWPGRAHRCGQAGGRAYGDMGDCDRGLEAPL